MYFRKVILNKEIQENIKRLESIMGNQPSNVKVRPANFTSNREKVNHGFEDETNTSKKLSEMKSNS